MKPIRFVIYLAVITITSCTEIPPFIDYSEPVVLLKDTTYLTSDIPQNPLKNVLIEDISGVRCNNCPKAADIAHNIQDNNDEGRVVVLTLHSNKYGAFTRPFGEGYDTFNTVVATEIISSLIGEPAGLPAGAIDRKLFDGRTSKINQKYETWVSDVNAQLALSATAVVDLEVINQGERKLAANVKTTFTKDDEDKVYLSVFLVESHILSKQKMPDNTYKDDYEHNSILREGITAYGGLKLADNVEAGRVFEKGFELIVPEKYNLTECSIVVLINKNDGNSTEVIQCAEKHVE